MDLLINRLKNLKKQRLPFAQHVVAGGVKCIAPLNYLKNDQILRLSGILRGALLLDSPKKSLEFQRDYLHASEWISRMAHMKRNSETLNLVKL